MCIRDRAIPILLYGSETWVKKKKDEQKVQTAEVKCLRSVKRCNRRDHISCLLYTSGVSQGTGTDLVRLILVNVDQHGDGGDRY